MNEIETFMRSCTRRDVEDEANLMPYCTFTDRESYFAWRAEWRRQYAELVEQIRYHRERRNPELYKDAGDHQSQREKKRSLAHCMLALRKVSKRLAAEQWEANEQPVVAATA